MTYCLNHFSLHYGYSYQDVSVHYILYIPIMVEILLEHRHNLRTFPDQGNSNKVLPRKQVMLEFIGLHSVIFPTYGWTMGSRNQIYELPSTKKFRIVYIKSPGIKNSVSIDRSSVKFKTLNSSINSS